MRLRFPRNYGSNNIVQIARVRTKVILVVLRQTVLMDNSLTSRIIGTVVAFFGWFAFIVLFLAFSPVSLDFWQNVAVFVASGAIVICIVAVLWIRWTMK